MSDINLNTALEFYTGGARCRFSNRERMHTVQKRLDQEGYTPFEFLHYVIHYHTKSNHWCNLKYDNLMTGQDCWNGFKRWKSGRLEEVRTVARVQYEAAEMYGANHPSEDVLLGRLWDAGPVAYMEIALFWEQEGREVPVESVAKRYAEAAAEVVLGAPEWLHVAPWFRKYIEKETNEAELWIMLKWTLKKKAPRTIG